MGGGQALPDGAELVAGALRRYALADAPEARQEMHPSGPRLIGGERLEVRGRPHIERLADRVHEFTREDADDFGGEVVEQNRTSNDGRVGTKQANPRFVTQDHDRRSRGWSLVGTEPPAERRGYAKQVEEIRGHLSRAERRRLADTGEDDGPEPERGQPFEGGTLTPPVAEVGDGHLTEAPIPRDIVFVDPHQPLRVRKRQRAEHDGVQK
jgi:hypothetical protein